MQKILVVFFILTFIGCNGVGLVEENLASKGDLFHKAFIQLIDEQAYEVAYTMLLPKVKKTVTYFDFLSYIGESRKNGQCVRKAKGSFKSFNFHSKKDLIKNENIVWTGKYLIECSETGEWTEEVAVSYDEKSKKFWIRNYSNFKTKETLLGAIRPIRVSEQSKIDSIKNAYRKIGVDNK